MAKEFRLVSFLACAALAGAPSPSSSAPPAGSQTQAFDDGSTLTTSPDGQTHWAKGTDGKITCEGAGCQQQAPTANLTNPDAAAAPADPTAPAGDQLKAKAVDLPGLSGKIADSVKPVAGPVNAFSADSEGESTYQSANRMATILSGGGGTFDAGANSALSNLSEVSLDLKIPIVAAPRADGGNAEEDAARASSPYEDRPGGRGNLRMAEVQSSRPYVHSAGETQTQ